MQSLYHCLRTVACLGALGLAGVLGAAEARAEQLATCKDWFAGRPVDAGYGEPIFQVISPELACFDGKIEEAIKEPVVRWIKTPARGKKVLGVRSTGGDAAVGLAIAEAMQAQKV